MTEAELLLLKLSTGHWPFRCFTGSPTTWLRNPKGKKGDPILICACHGFAFDSEKLVNDNYDWRRNTCDLDVSA